MQQLEEEELMEECYEAMLEEERQHQRNLSSVAWTNATRAESNSAELCQQLGNLKVEDDDLAKEVSDLIKRFDIIHTPRHTHFEYNVFFLEQVKPRCCRIRADLGTK